MTHLWLFGVEVRVGIVFAKPCEDAGGLVQWPMVCNYILNIQTDL